MIGELWLDNVSARTSQAFGLSDIQLILKPGELVGVIGPNGAGKSTLAKAIVGLLELHGGEIRYTNKSINSLSGKQRAALIGYLPQSAKFSWDLSVADAVKLGRINRSQSSSEESSLDRVLSEVGISHLAQRQVHRLSGGEQMRVHLARLFYGEHKILILDEPCAALDVEHQHRIMRLLREYSQNRGAMVILHDFNLAQTFCDRLILLDAGEIVLCAAPEVIFKSPITAKVFGVEFRQYDFNTSDGPNESITLPHLPADSTDQ